MSSTAVLDDLAKIKEMIDAGYSITLSKKVVMNKRPSFFRQKVTSNPAYVEMLNNYMIKIGKNRSYKLENGRVVVDIKKQKESR